MYDYISIIHNDPAVTGEALLLPLFIVFGANIFNGGLGECVEHAVTGAGTNDEIVSKGDNIFKVYQDYILPFFIFQGVYDFTCEF